MFIQKHQPAFLAPHPLITTSKRYTSNLCTRQNRTRNGKYFRPLMLAEKDTQTSTNPKQVAKLSSRLSTLLADVDRGLEFDPDADELDPLEDEIELVIEELEPLNPTQVPTRSPLMDGKWKLAYTSSSITRFFGGLSGLQRLLPEGSVGAITQTISLEDGFASFDEILDYEIPILGNEMQHKVEVEGNLRALDEERQIWEPEKIRFFKLNWWADSWKTLRAFQVADVTYLDEKWRVARGQTGSICVFEKIDENDE